MILQGYVHGVCNGLYMPKMSPDYATAAWLLEDSCFPQQSLCHGITHVSGSPSEINAYWLELQGSHVMLLAVRSFCDFYQVSAGCIHLAVANLVP